MKTQLDFMYEHERLRPDRIWLTQPMGGGVLRDLTFKQAMSEVRRVAAYLRGLGLPPGSRVAIFAKNNAWWVLADLAIWMAGHVTVPIYPTLTADTVRQILEHSGASVVFVGKLDGFPAMEPGIPASVARITLPLAPPCPGDRWEDIVQRTQPITDNPTRAPDDLATIIYTSGSTGAPKGAMHSFRTMCVAGQTFADSLKCTIDDRAISYLPLAHVAERACLESVNFIVGFHVFFAESLDTFLEDVKRARPTIFGSVPRLWLKFQSGVHAKMPPAKLDRLLRIPILGRVVRRKVLSGLGLDQVRAAVSGSAPIPKELLEWYARLGLEIREVYGMTENFALSHAVQEGDSCPGYVGKPMPGVTQRISENGEVLVKSPSNTLGYYNAPELTAELIDKEGWLHTGDRGEIDAAGRLRITGRVKELFKTSKGKYVAPAPIENQLLAHPFVEQALVCGANMPQPFALVVLSAMARQSGSPDEARGVLATLRAGINARLDPHEQLERLVVVSEEWTVENGMLTPTLKVKRAAIEGRYGRHTEAWYARTEDVIFHPPER
jgi:long-chain acyl-CoA synthetase